MNSDWLYSYNMLVFSKMKDASECAEGIRELFGNKLFEHFKLTFVDNLHAAEKELTTRFFGIFAVHATENDFNLIRSAVELRNRCRVNVPVIVLLEGDAVNLDITDILQLDVTDVAVCSNKQWLTAVLTKHMLITRNPENIHEQNGIPVYSSFINSIHQNLPFGIIRLIIEPEIYVEYINREAQRILNVTHRELLAQPELIQRFLPEERIHLIIQNAGTGQDFLKKRFKINLEGEIFHWVEAIYIPGFEYRQHFMSIEILLRDVTDEEINRALQKGVYDVARLSSSNFSLNRIFTIIHKIISDIICIDNFYIALYDWERKEVSFPFFVDTKDTKPPNTRRNGKGLTEYVIKTGKSLLCRPDCLNSLLVKNEIEAIGTLPKSWLGVPLKFHGNIIGVMVVQHYQNPDAFTEREQYILEFFSEQVARTIDYKRKSDSVKLLSTAVEQSPVSIVITTLKPEIVYVNSAFTRVTGYEPAEVLGKNPRFLKSGKTPPEHYLEMWNTITEGSTWQGEFINKRKNGEIFYENSIIVPVSDELGKNAYYLAVKLDITDQKKLIELGF